MSIERLGTPTDELSRRMAGILMDNGGVIAETELEGGRHLSATFARVGDALRAALDLAEADGTVRIGVHAGEIESADRDGREVAKLGRIARFSRYAAPPRGVVVTETVRTLASQTRSVRFAPSGMTPRTGEERLRLYRVVRDGARPLAGERPDRLLVVAGAAGLTVLVAVGAWAFMNATSPTAPGQTTPPTGASTSLGRSTTPVNESSTAPSRTQTASIVVSQLSGRIVFVGVPLGGGTSQLFVADADGTNVSQITDDDAADSSAPSWTPDATVVYSRKSRDDPKPRIWTVGEDGTDADELVDAVADEPAWSPDGVLVAIRRQKELASGFDGIDIFDIRDGTFTGFVTEGTSPSWFPDSETVAVSTGSTSVDADLYSIGIDRSNASQLTSTSDVQERAPDVNDAGTMIAFVQSQIGAAGDIATLSIATRSGQTLTLDSFDDQTPAWSPDGSSIIFSSNRGADNKFDLYAVPADGGEPVLVLAIDGWDLYMGDWIAVE